MTDNQTSSFLSDQAMAPPVSSAESSQAAIQVIPRQGPGCGGMPGIKPEEVEKLMPNDVFLGPVGTYDPVTPNNSTAEYLQNLAERLDRVLANSDDTLSEALLEFFRERGTNMNIGFLDRNFPVLRDWPKKDLRLLTRWVRDSCSAKRIPVITNMHQATYRGSELHCQTAGVDYYTTYSRFPQDRPAAPIPPCA
jgi:hypothetical protein